jgi:hypothetical protein
MKDGKPFGIGVLWENWNEPGRVWKVLRTSPGYDRLLGATADYDLALTRERLTDIVGTAIAPNRDLIVGPAAAEPGTEDEELDHSIDDRDYARKLIASLTPLDRGRQAKIVGSGRALRIRSGRVRGGQTPPPKK